MAAYFLLLLDVIAVSRAFTKSACDTHKQNPGSNVAMRYHAVRKKIWVGPYALINVKRDPSPMGRVTGLGGDSIDFRLPGKGVFERTRGRLGDCPCDCAEFTIVRTTKPYVV